MEQVTIPILIQFKKETDIMMKMRPHENVLPLLGICSKKSPYCIITPFIDGGSLETLLLGTKKITQQEMLDIVKGVAKGLYHLHCEQIVHRDLASRNILLREKKIGWQPIISDFGLSREYKRDTGKTRSDTGPLKIMAPECLINREYSFASDVWSFSVLLAEIYTRKEPYPKYNAIEVASRVGRKKLVPETPENMPSILVEISKACSAYYPNDRITMVKVCKTLDSV